MVAKNLNFHRGNLWDSLCVGYLFEFAVAAFLRIQLSLVNREANDNHYEVVKLLLEGRSGLTMADCSWAVGAVVCFDDQRDNMGRADCHVDHFLSPGTS